MDPAAAPRMGVHGRDGGTRRKAARPPARRAASGSGAEMRRGAHHWAVQRPLTVWPATLQVTAPEALLDARFAVPV